VDSDLYGSKSLSIDELKAAVEPVLGIEFAPHYGDYRGGDYWYWGPLGEGESITIQLNAYDTADPDEILEEEFAEYAVLLHLEATERADEVRDALAVVADLDFLERTHWRH
jgi:hypothetical protein